MNYDDLRKPIIAEEGKSFRNFTGRYLLPQVKLLSPTVLSELNKFTPFAFGLCDRQYPNYSEFDNKLFILVPMKGNLNYWMDHYEYYLYQDGKADKLMVILDLPINNRSAFLEGRFSELYSTKEAKELIPRYYFNNGVKHNTSAWNVVHKEESARLDFQKRLNKDFNLKPPVVVKEDQEYEYPPTLIREIFNY